MGDLPYQLVIAGVLNHQHWHLKKKLEMEIPNLESIIFRLKKRDDDQSGYPGLNDLPRKLSLKAPEFQLLSTFIFYATKLEPKSRPPLWRKQETSQWKHLT